MKSLFAAFIFLFICSVLPFQALSQGITHARTETGRDVALYPDGTWEYIVKPSRREVNKVVGSANKLTGNIYSVAIFISTRQNPWTRSEKTKALQKQKDAEDWLVAQAKRYSIDLKFQGGIYGLEDDIPVPNIPTNDPEQYAYKYWVAYLLSLIGWKSPQDLLAWVQKNTNCKNVHIIVYANSKARSYALPLEKGANINDFFVEGTLIHYRYYDGSEVSPFVIAHEILHLYGAWDLYANARQTRDRELKAKEHFPNDVMLRAADLSNLRVDPLTAWLIGWNNKPEPWYEWFKPAGY